MATENASSSQTEATWKHETEKDEAFQILLCRLRVLLRSVEDRIEQALCSEGDFPYQCHVLNDANELIAIALKIADQDTKDK